MNPPIEIFKSTDIHSVLIIGQACEFDYSGTQACKALKKKGCRSIQQ